MSNRLFQETLKQIEFPEVIEKISGYCFSELGKEQILTHEPVNEIYWLRKEHDLLEEMIYLLSYEDKLPFDGLSDVRPKLYKAMVANAVLSSEEILSVHDFIRVSRLIKGYFHNREEKAPLLREESAFLHDNRMLEKHINEAIDETGNIRDSASRELARIRHDINEKSQRLRTRLQKILKRVSEESLLQDEFVSLREGRFVLPVKVENKRQIPGIIHGVSQTGATVFLEPSEIIEMNNELSLLSNEEKREIYRILGNLTKEIGEEAGEFVRSTAILSHIDALHAKAEFALKFGGIKPKILDENVIYMKAVRHPLLVASKGVKKVIPLDIEFSPELRGHLISGPNAGGKTVALKSIGVNIAMALSGIFPLGEVRTNYRSIYSLIGDHQSIANDLSTFSSQIHQLKEIIESSFSDSLILIDEIGSGTDPQEGGALAAGVLDTFLEMKLFFVATTHQSSLKSYALNRKEIRNDSLEFDENNLHPTYKFMQGIPGNSYAFVLAESIGLSRLVIERAKQYVGTRQTELEESIRMLQKFKYEAEELKIAADKEKITAEKIRKDFEQRLSDIKQKKQIYIAEAREQADKIISTANSLIEKTIKEIREEKKSVAEVKKEFNTEKNKLISDVKSVLKENEPKNKKLNEELKIGDSVNAQDSENVGTIIEFENNGKFAIVEFNGVKFKFKTDTLSKSMKSPGIKSSSSSSDYISFDAKTTLDMRGMRADEGLRELGFFISKAVMGNLTSVSIIHGKGTGALRQAVHDYLAHHPSVTAFRLGTLVEGGAGITIVEI